MRIKNCTQSGKLFITKSSDKRKQNRTQKYENMCRWEKSVNNNIFHRRCRKKKLCPIVIFMGSVWVNIDWKRLFLTIAWRGEFLQVAIYMITPNKIIWIQENGQKLIVGTFYPTNPAVCWPLKAQPIKTRNRRN